MGQSFKRDSEHCLAPLCLILFREAGLRPRSTSGQAVKICGGQAILGTIIPLCCSVRPALSRCLLVGCSVESAWFSIGTVLMRHQLDRPDLGIRLTQSRSMLRTVGTPARMSIHLHQAPGYFCTLKRTTTGTRNTGESGNYLPS